MSETEQITSPDVTPEAMPQKRTDRIVVGVDGSDHSKRALRWAAYLARLEDAPIEAVMVWEPPAPAGYGWNFVARNSDPMPEMQKALTETIDDVFGADRPQHLTLHTVLGYPAAQLLKAAKDAGLLIVGSRGHGGFANLLLGSVSARCSEHAQCPVLVVHDTEPPS